MTEWVITSTALIIAVLLIRGMIKEKISLSMRYAMWLIVVVRLLIPFTIPDSPFSVMNFTKQAVSDAVNENEEGTLQMEAPADAEQEGSVVSHRLQGQMESDIRNVVQYEQEEPVNNAGSIKEKPSLQEILTLVWLGVMLAGLVLVMTVNLRFYRKLLKSRKRVCQDIVKDIPVYETEAVSSPCLFGIFKPCIYLKTIPADRDMLVHILSHEYTHYRHCDYIWAFVRVICVCIHWYNPFVWLAAWVSAGDCELSCDEGAIRRIGEEHRIAYGETLIHMLAAVNGISGAVLGSTSMLESKRSLRERVGCIAQKRITCQWAAVVMLAAVILAGLCTFTGMNDGLKESRVKQQILNQGGYGEAVVCKLFTADYDRDGSEDAFAVVFAEETAEENGFADIWYYDGQTEDTRQTEEEIYICTLGDSMQIAELTDKTLFVYNVLHGDIYYSHALGIQDGTVKDYFEGTEGRFISAEGNNIELWTFPLNSHMIDGLYFGRTVMPQYLYYNAAADSIMTWRAYAITQDEALEIGNVEAFLEKIKEEYADKDYELIFAVRNDLLHIMPVVYEGNTIFYYYYTFRVSDNSIGEPVSSGDGFYDDIDRDSQRVAEEYETEKLNLKIQAFAQIQEEYLAASQENIIYTGITYGEDDSDSGVLFYYILKEDYSCAVRREECTLWWDGEEYQIQSLEAYIYEDIQSAEAFESAYEYYPDFFEAGIVRNILHEEISEYENPFSAAIYFFNLSGGYAISKDDGLSSSSTVVYTYADGSQTELEMYRTAGGIWLPVSSRFGGDSKEINDWYASLAEEDFAAALEITMELLENNTVDLVRLAEFEEYGVTIFGADDGSAIIVEHNGNRFLYSGEWLTPRAVLPEFAMGDYDGDGIPEIAVSEYCGSGTGVSIERLSMIDSTYEFYDIIYRFQNSEEAVNSVLEYRYEESLLLFWLQDEDRQYGFDYKEGIEDRVLKNVGAGDIIDYEFDGDGEIVIYARLKYYASDIISGTWTDDEDCPNAIMADVNYEGNGNFTLTNFSLCSVP